MVSNSRLLAPTSFFHSLHSATDNRFSPTGFIFCQSIRSGTQAQAASYVLDFDQDANGDLIDFSNLGISVGDWENSGPKENYIISNQWFADFGVYLSAYDKPQYNATTGDYSANLAQLKSRDLVLFNTDPNYYSEQSDARKNNGDFKSGGTFDDDLLTGHDDLKGKTYLWEKGDSTKNPWNLGNVLIIQENNTYHKPDDRSNGGLIAFSFEDMISLTSIDLLDIDDFGRRGKQIVFTAYGENDEKLNTWMFDEESIEKGTAERLSEQKGDNSLYRFNFNQQGVQRLEVLYPGSGAIAALRWENNQDPPTVPEPVSVLSLLAVVGAGWQRKRSRLA